MSICVVQIRAVIIAPQIEIVAIAFERRGKLCGSIEANRMKPYPPSFRRIPAKSIEPTTGASTWAFGSHKWNR